MKAVELNNNVVKYAETQPEYTALPALRKESGAILICWKLNWRERLSMLFFGKLWHQVLTFNSDLQPILITTFEPKDWKNEIHHV